MHIQTAAKWCFTLALLTTLSPAPWAAATSAWTEVLKNDARLAPQVRWLEVGTDRSLYLYRPSEAAEARGTLVLMHDLHGHADWPRIIGPLRQRLPEHAWSTWSLQLPAPAGGDDAEGYRKETGARLTAALSAIAEQNDLPIFLLGAGTGASAALGYVTQNPDNPVRGVVAVSLRPLPGQTDADVRAMLQQVAVPVLEVFAERDLPDVLRGVHERQPLARAGKPKADAPPARYRQMLMEGADADYNGQTDVLTKRIRGWLRLHADR